MTTFRSPQQEVNLRMDHSQAGRRQSVNIATREVCGIQPLPKLWTYNNIFTSDRSCRPLLSFIGRTWWLFTGSVPVSIVICVPKHPNILGYLGKRLDRSTRPHYSQMLAHTIVKASAIHHARWICDALGMEESLDNSLHIRCIHEMK